MMNRYIEKEYLTLAKKDDYVEVRAFYHSLIDAMEHAPYKPGWEKEVYPSDAYLKESMEREELYIGIKDGRISSAMIINHEYNESYEKILWPTEAKPEEITVIHALGVHPDFSQKGIGKKLVKEVIALAETRNQKVIRLDVLSGNIPAEKLYTGMGFQYIDTIQMYYEDTGWTDFKLYEYKIAFK